MKAIIDKEKCIGCLLCPSLCPEIFRMEGDKAVVYADSIPQSSENCIRDSAAQCPVEAIVVVESA